MHVCVCVFRVCVCSMRVCVCVYVFHVCVCVCVPCVCVCVCVYMIHVCVCVYVPCVCVCVCVCVCDCVCLWGHVHPPPLQQTLLFCLKMGENENKQTNKKLKLQCQSCRDGVTDLRYSIIITKVVIFFPQCWQSLFR